MYLYEQVAAEITELIRQGTFPPGERVPSVRQLSRQKKISVATALQAYLLLEDQGLIEARPQSGYYVRQPAAEEQQELDVSTPAPDPTRVGMRELVMMILRDTANPGLIQLGTAFPNPELVANDKLSRIMVSIARQARQEHGLYDIPPGNEALRIQIAQRSVLSGCHLTPADIIITSGIIEAYSLSLRSVCRPGDTVAIESPAYFANLQALEALDLRALEIPAHPRLGISLEALRFGIEPVERWAEPDVPDLDIGEELFLEAFVMVFVRVADHQQVEALFARRTRRQLVFQHGNALAQSLQRVEFVAAVDQDVDIPVQVGHAQVDAVAQANVVQAH